jgi:rhodanese-related sulfurtransferase
VVKNLLFSLFVLFFLAGCSEEILYFNIDNQQLKSMMDEGVTIIDIRRPEEWKQTGVVKGSQRLTSFDKGGRLMPSFLPTFTNNISKDQPVILICRTGNRTQALSTHLSKELGYTNIFNVKNGITSWIREGLPVTRI